MGDEDTLEPVQQGEVQPTTWGEVAVGHIVRDKKFRMHTVVDERAGWLQLSAVRTGEVSTIRRPAPDTPVDIYVPSEQECLIALGSLGPRYLRDVEDREYTKTRSLMWRLDPVARSAKALRDHLDMIHGDVKVEDVVYAHNTAREKKDSPRAKAKLQELVDLHDEMHADPHLWPQAFPHHHKKAG
jgi:hypothetical protein